MILHLDRLTSDLFINVAKYLQLSLILCYFQETKVFFWKKDRIERHLDTLLPLSTPVFIHLHCTITAWLNFTFIYLNFFHIIEKTGLRSSLLYFWYLHEFDYCILLRLLEDFESFLCTMPKRRVWWFTQILTTSTLTAHWNF